MYQHSSILKFLLASSIPCLSNSLRMSYMSHPFVGRCTVASQSPVLVGGVYLYFKANTSLDRTLGKATDLIVFQSSFPLFWSLTINLMVLKSLVSISTYISLAFFLFIVTSTEYNICTGIIKNLLLYESKSR